MVDKEQKGKGIVMSDEAALVAKVAFVDENVLIS